MALAEVMVQPVNEEKQTKSTPQDDEMSSAMAFRTRFMSSEQQQHEQQHEQEMRAHSDVHRNHFLESARVEVPMDRVFLRRVWEDVGRAWGWCALCAVAHSPFATYGTSAIFSGAVGSWTISGGIVALIDAVESGFFACEFCESEYMRAALSRVHSKD